MKRVTLVVLGALACLLQLSIQVYGANCPANATQFTVNFSQKSVWDHFWEAAVGSGHALLTLRADYQKHLQAAHIDLGVKSVRFHAIFDDDMSVLLSNDTLNPSSYSWANVDTSYDYIVSLGMKPIVEMSFMPNLISSKNGGWCVFHYCGNVNPPKHWTDWFNLVQHFAQHLIDRYGIDEVSSWYFEVWNEPNLGFWSGGQGYYDLYRYAAAAIKAIDPRLKIGGPITAASVWIEPFRQYCQQNKIPLDFIDTHIYPTDYSPTTRGSMIPIIERTLEQAKGLPVIYSEYNSGLYSPGFHDDPFASAFVMYNLQLANTRNLTQKGLRALSYWCVSDIFEEEGFISIPWHEGFGIQTIHQVPKPVYRAFELLHRTGNTRFGVNGSHPSAGLIAVESSDGSGLMVIIYNHDVPEVNISVARVCVELPGVRQSDLEQVYLERIDEDHSYGKKVWEQMGSPTYPNKSQILEMLTASMLVKQKLSVVDSSAGISFTLDVPPQGVAAVSIQLR